MVFRLLGPLEIENAGSAIRVAGGKERALLTLLLLHANRTASRELLIDELWGQCPPPSARHALEAHVSRLRHALERGGGSSLIETLPGGYRIRLDELDVDVKRFEHLCAEGRAALTRDDAAAAEEQLTAALALWRGEALAGLAAEPFAAVEAARLEDLRLGALEMRAAARLALGRHAEVVAELEALVAEQPLRETLRARLMLALYRSGRQADALAAYQNGRRLLVDELGIEPSRELQELQEAILRHDSALDAPPAVPVRTERREEPPAPIVGRERELAALGELWKRVCAERRCRLAAVVGDAGVGKTWLARAFTAALDATVVHGRCPPDADCGGYWPLIEALDELGVLDSDAAELAALGSLLADAGESAADEMAWAVRETLEQAAAARPLVVVFDDVHDAGEQFLDLVEQVAAQSNGEPILILCLGRDRLVARRPDWPVAVRLAPLADAAVEELIPPHVSGELRRRIVRAARGNPLRADELVARWR